MYKSKVDANIGDVIKIPTSNYSFVKEIEHISNFTYEKIASKLRNLTSHVKFVSNSLNDLGASSIKLDKLESIMKQYEPNNYVSYQVHCVSLTVVIFTVLFVVYYFKIFKICKKSKKQYLPVVFRQKQKESSEEVSELDEMPLEDRIRISHKNRNKSRTKNDPS